MADSYTLKTATDANVKYDDIQVEVAEAPVIPKRIKTVLEVKNAVLAIDDSITALQAERAVLVAELDAIKAEADKVTTATDKASQVVIPAVK